MLLLDRDYVHRELTLKRCIPAIRDAMIALSTGDTDQILRQILPLAQGRAFGVMQGRLRADFGTKAISVFPDNFAHGLQSHQGLVLLFDPQSGAPSCLAHAGEITAIRTAAASAVATDVLARPGASRLALLGYGEQALMHARAIAEVRQLSAITIWGRKRALADALATKLAKELGVEAQGCGSVADAVEQTDIVCTLTGSADPILLGEWIRPGTHVNAVGASQGASAEIDNALVLAARLFPDHRASVLAQGGEFLRAKAAGLVDDAHVLAEIGVVLAGTADGRVSAEDVTVYKSLGNIVQDLASAALLQEIASAQSDAPRFEI